MQGFYIKSEEDYIDAMAHIRYLQKLKSSITVNISLANENPWDQKIEQDGAPMLNMDQMKNIAHHIYDDDKVPDGEETVCSDTNEETLEEDIYFSDMYANRVHISQEDRIIKPDTIVKVPDGRLTRKRLLQKSDQNVWKIVKKYNLKHIIVVVHYYHQFHVLKMETS